MKKFFKRTFGISLFLLSLITIASCDKEKEKEEEKDVYTYGEWTLAIAPTFSTTGLIKREIIGADLYETCIIPAINSDDYDVTIKKSPSCIEKGDVIYTYKDINNISFEQYNYGNHTESAICRTCGTVIDEGFFNEIHLEEIEDFSLNLNKFKFSSSDESYSNNYTVDGLIKGLIDDEGYVKLYGDINVVNDRTNLNMNLKENLNDEYKFYYQNEILYLKNNDDDVKTYNIYNLVDEDDPNYKFSLMFESILNLILPNSKLELKNIETNYGFILMNAIFDLVDYQDDYKFLLSSDKLLNYNDFLNEIKLSQIIDLIASNLEISVDPNNKDFMYYIKSFINEIIFKNINKYSNDKTKSKNYLINLLENTNVNVIADDIINKYSDTIDELEEKITEYINDALNYLGIDYEIDLKTLLGYDSSLSEFLYDKFNKEEKLNEFIDGFINESELLSMIFGADFNVESFIENMFDVLQNYTVYDLISSAYNYINLIMPDILDYIANKVEDINMPNSIELANKIRNIKESIAIKSITSEEIHNQISAIIMIVDLYIKQAYFTIDSDTGVINELYLELLSVPLVSKLPSGSIDIKFNSNVLITEDEIEIFEIANID